MSDSDASLVGYCGMYCGDCIPRIENPAELAQKMLKIVQSDQFKTIAKGLPKAMPIFEKLSLYDDFCEFLGTMGMLSCNAPCRENGGFPDCVIRTCCHKRNIEGCWRCDDFSECRHITWLCQIHPDAPIKNISKIKEHGMEAYLEGEKVF